MDHEEMVYQRMVGMKIAAARVIRTIAYEESLGLPYNEYWDHLPEWIDGGIAVVNTMIDLYCDLDEDKTINRVIHSLRKSDAEENTAFAIIVMLRGGKPYVQYMLENDEEQMFDTALIYTAYFCKKYSDHDMKNVSYENAYRYLKMYADAFLNHVRHAKEQEPEWEVIKELLKVRYDERLIEKLKDI